LKLSEAQASDKIRFEMRYNPKMSNSTLSVERERTLIKMKTSIKDNDLIVHNELGED